MFKKLTTLIILCLFSSLAWSQEEVSEEDVQTFQFMRKAMWFPFNLESYEESNKHLDGSSITKLACQFPKEVTNLMGQSMKQKIGDEIIVFAFNESFLAMNDPYAGAWIALQWFTTERGVTDIWHKRWDSDIEGAYNIPISSTYNDVLIKVQIKSNKNPNDIPWENGAKEIANSKTYTVNRVNQQISYSEYRDMITQIEGFESTFSLITGNGMCETMN